MRFHHVAYVTANLERKSAELADLLKLRRIGAPVVDSVQGVRILFMEASDGGLVELLEPHGERSPVARHLQQGGGLYHVCFEVDDLDGTLQRLRASVGAVVICEPVPAPAIAGRRVAFVVTEDRDLIEFVEAKQK
jgi:catechol 2,3-dioxygenase-like lactoylglutathione lyase family enzyme